MHLLARLELGRLVHLVGLDAPVSRVDLPWIERVLIGRVDACVEVGVSGEARTNHAISAPPHRLGGSKMKVLEGLTRSPYAFERRVTVGAPYIMRRLEEHEAARRRGRHGHDGARPDDARQRCALAHLVGREISRIQGAAFGAGGLDDLGNGNVARVERLRALGTEASERCARGRGASTSSRYASGCPPRKKLGRRAASRYDERCADEADDLGEVAPHDDPAVRESACQARRPRRASSWRSGC